jgi:hypothetical protein
MNARKSGEDETSQCLSEVLNMHPSLGDALIQLIVPNCDWHFGLAESQMRLGEAHPDIVIYDSEQRLRVYIEAKINAKFEPHQLVRGRNNMVALATEPFAVCLLSSYFEVMPPGVSFDGCLKWFRCITWRQAFISMRHSARSDCELSSLDAFRELADARGAFPGGMTSDPSKIVRALAPESGHDWGAIFCALQSRHLDLSWIGGYGYGISPSVMVGAKHWGAYLRGGAVERVSINYHLPRYTKSEERYVFQVVLWQDHSYPCSDGTKIAGMAAKLQRLAAILGAEWEIGTRSHKKKRIRGSVQDRLPPDADLQFVGLVNVWNRTITTHTKMSEQQLVDQLSKKVVGLISAVDSVLAD